MKCTSFLIALSIAILVSFHFHSAMGYNYKLHQLMDENEMRFYFNANSRESKIPEYEIVELRTVIKRDVSESTRTGGASYSLHFSAFERPIHMNLKLNEHLLSPGFRAWRINEQGEREDIFGDEKFQRNCYYLHRNENSVAALNNCDEDKFAGIMALEEDILEIQPLSQRLKNILKTNQSEFGKNSHTYLVKKFATSKNIGNVLSMWRKRRSIVVDGSTLNKSNNESTNTERLIKREAQLTVEVGLFFDEAAYKIFAPLFNFDDRKLSEMLLAYMNGVQVLYHHPSLGVPIDITIVHMEIMRRQPKSLPTYNGERDQLLDSFCAYQKRINPPEDNDPNHWDMGLYVSGLDFYSYENGVNSGSTMGLATVRGVCTDIYDCVITEFGATNTFGRPYPSAGFASVYILAHEMGHNLGMSHDSSGNHCSREGYIMSPSRGTQGETTWSPCSADIARELFNWANCLKDRPLATPKEYNAWRYSGYPGQIWSAKRQCELLLTDKDSIESPTTGIRDICQNLQCRSPHRSGYFFAGPALEGTDCGGNNWCEGGYCSPKRPVPRPETVVKGGWGPWQNEKCNSGCITNSKGAQARRRTCTNPTPVNTNEGCVGPSYDVILCNDNPICRNSRRHSPISYASAKCRDFSRLVPDLDPKGLGLQATHETNRLWVGCAIYCRRKSTGTFYTPRFELNDLGINPYFPDGTLCHTHRNEKYYCLQHHCLPEGFQFNKNNIFLLSEDVPISGNANPKPMQPLNSKLMDYLSLDQNGKPLLQHILVEDLAEYQINEKWIDDVDYRIVPSLKEKQSNV